MTLHMADV